MLASVPGRSQGRKEGGQGLGNEGKTAKARGACECVCQVSVHLCVSGECALPGVKE